MGMGELEGKSNVAYDAENEPVITRHLTQPQNMEKVPDGSSWMSTILSKHSRLINIMFVALAVILYHVYFFYSIYRHLYWELPIWSCGESCPNTGNPFWCDSIAFLILLTIFSWAGVAYGYAIKPLLGKTVSRAAAPIIRKVSSSIKNKVVLVLLYILPILAIVTFVVVDSLSYNDEGKIQMAKPARLISLGGAFLLILIGWVFSTSPMNVRWRHIVWGLSIQFVLALMVLRWEFGKNVVQCLSSKVSTFLGYTDAGSLMVFGYLVDGKPFISSNFQTENETITNQVRLIMDAINDTGAFAGGIFMFKILSIIYFFSFFVNMLYYWGVLQFIVLKLGWLLYVTIGTTAGESMNASANIFLGQTEAPLLIKPFLPVMTKSEIHAVMTGGYATIAGTVLGAYILLGIEAADLITASVMAAPTALAVSKLFLPETEVSKTTIKDVKIEKGDDANVLDAAAKGASQAVGLVLNIAASLIAFKAFVAFLDGLIGWFGVFAGKDDLTFQSILGILLWPLAFIMGIPSENCETVARLIGMKVLVTEFPAFQDLANIKAACAADPSSEKCILTPRSITIATYALCGFANLPSIGVQLGGLSALAPERKSDMAQVVLRAMIAGCWVSFMNACVAGALSEV